MMDYEVFKKAVKENILAYMPEMYRDMDVHIAPVKKVGCTQDGLSLLSREKEVTISPTVYIDHLYEKYQCIGDLDVVLKDLAVLLDTAFAEMPSVTEVGARIMQEDIVFQLINTKRSQEFLQDVPHRAFYDMSIIYRLVLRQAENGTESTVINNKLAKKMGLDEEQLYQKAMEGTRRLFPAVTWSMEDAMKEVLLRGGMPQELAEQLPKETRQDDPMWVISNVRFWNGATAILYQEELRAVAGRLGSSLYILPTSIHELITIPVIYSRQEPEEMTKLVKEINASDMEPGEVLSDQVFFYDKETGALSLVADGVAKEESPETNKA